MDERAWKLRADRRVESSGRKRPHVATGLRWLLLLPLAVGLTSCLNFGEPAAGPLMTVCLGEFGQSMTVQSLITQSGATSGCPTSSCNLRLDVTTEYDNAPLCEDQSVEIIVQNGTALLWNKTHNFAFLSSGFPGIDPTVGHSELISGGTVSAGDVLSVTAQAISNSNPASCKRQGFMQIEITLLQ